MRILHVSSSFPFTDTDSTAPFMQEMTAALVGRGHEVRIVLPHHSALVTGLRSGVDTVSYKYWPGSDVWGYGSSLTGDDTVRGAAIRAAPAAVASMIATTRRELTRFDPDVVHLHWLLPQGVAALSLPKRIPVVISLHGAEGKLAERSRLFTALSRSILRRASHLVAASQELLNMAIRIEPDSARHSTVIPHGANSRLFRSVDRADARAELDIGPSENVVLAVGRLVEKKGFEFLIRAMAKLDDAAGHAYIVGDGPLGPKLEALARQVAPTGVTFLGSLDRVSLAQWYAAADIMVIPSVRGSGDVDSGPVVLMEAMAAGCAVVATLVGMAPDVIEDGVNGRLVPSADPDALASAIAAALQRAPELGSAARKRFEQIGDWSRVAAELERIYIQSTKDSKQDRPGG